MKTVKIEFSQGEAELLIQSLRGSRNALDQAKDIPRKARKGLGDALGFMIKKIKINMEENR